MRLRPAIDLRGGKVVRLYEGDYDRETVYASDPVAAAQALRGADGLHLVDLDGALEGRPVHLETVERIVRDAPLPVEFGGGLRRFEDIEAVLGLGVERVLLGTAALRDRRLLRSVLERFGPGRIGVSLDARGQEVRVAGWREGGGVRLTEVAELLRLEGVRILVHTAVDRDGTMRGPDLGALQSLSPFGFELWAAGGIGSLDDLRLLGGLPFLTGAVIGRALYEGRFTLAEALAAVDGHAG